MTQVLEKKRTFRDVPKVSLEELTFDVETMQVKDVVECYKRWGCVVVRGLNRAFAPSILKDVNRLVDEGIEQLEHAEKVPAGWMTPNGILWLPAPKNYEREKQVMVIPLNYKTSGSFFQSALNPAQLDIVEGIVGPNIELKDNGQCLCKEPVGGHPKNLHQDGSYFKHKYEGPVAVLSYAQDTTVEMGALRIIPGSHKLGLLPHTDTFSHLGLDLEDWPWESALTIEGKAGDAIFFHINCIHGSKTNQSEKRRAVFIHRYRDPEDYTIVQGHSTDQLEEQAEAEGEVRKDDYNFLVRGFRSIDRTK